VNGSGLVLYGMIAEADRCVQKNDFSILGTLTTPGSSDIIIPTNLNFLLTFSPLSST